MKALVTGGAGFIGSHLVDTLLADGHEVIVLDNLSTGRRENIAHIKSSKFTFVEVDVANYDAISTHFNQIDWVFHLAALADIVPSIERPLDYHRANVDGTAAVLEAARQSQVKRFVYAASSSCYGLAEEFPTPETAKIQPMYPYALSKNIGEQYVLHWGNVYNLPVVSLRFFNVYGPRARTSGTYGAVFGVFLAQKINSKPYTIVGDGTQTRDFTFVTDVAAACLCAAKSNVSKEVFNIGSGGTYSINDLIAQLGGPKVYVPKRPGEPDCTFADVSKIANILGWKAKVSFSEGVQRMLEHVEDWKAAPVWEPDSIATATQTWHRYLGDKS